MIGLVTRPWTSEAEPVFKGKLFDHNLVVDPYRDHLVVGVAVEGHRPSIAINGKYTLRKSRLGTANQHSNYQHSAKCVPQSRRESGSSVNDYSMHNDPPQGIAGPFCSQTLERPYEPPTYHPNLERAARTSAAHRTVITARSHSYPAFCTA